MTRPADPPEPDCSVVYAEAGAADRRDGVLLKAGDARNQPLALLDSPLAYDLFVERQADGELEQGDGFRVEAGHGWQRSAPTSIAGEWEAWPTLEDLRAFGRAAAERRRFEWLRNGEWT
jgi:hypothetical protein